jgi:hypothetical protein
MTRQDKTVLRSAGCGLVAVLSLLTIANGPARAADPYASLATPAARAACTPDVYRLCAGEIPSVSGITACLRRKKASLSEACRAVFEQ